MLDRRPCLTLLLLLLVAACPEDAKDTNTDATTSVSAGSTSTGSSSDATTEAPTSTTATSAGSTDASTDTGALDCSPAALPACPVQGCREDWSFSCPGCGEFLPQDTCFEIDVGCAYPALNCALPDLCPRVWGQGYDVIEGLEDDAAATCFLSALRDGKPGRFTLLYGEMLDSPLVYMDVYYGGKDRVLVEYFFECEGCPDSGYFGRTGQLALQPDAYFDGCLAAPDTAALIQCVFGFTDFPAGEPPAADYAPPWTTGECVSLELVCP